MLAVGDAAFQKKCLGKMDEVAKRGRTILFVSHNMDAIINLCSVVHVVEGGRISEPLSPEEGVQCHLTRNLNKSLAERSRFQLFHRPPIIRNVSIRREGARESTIATGQGVHFDIELRDFEDIKNIRCGLIITNQRSQRVVIFHSQYHGNFLLRPSGLARISCHVPALPLVPGTYYVDVALADEHEVIERLEQAVQFEVIFADILGSGRVPSSNQGHVILPCEWSAQEDQSPLPAR